LTKAVQRVVTDAELDLVDLNHAALADELLVKDPSAQP
jgi:hypothetical protein